ncbi:MAG: FAD-binding oxidoreductase [Proteobacteria bacterium]|nr:MAG: FAD-binding oxidoreductase [Pseudomonadota bacterium]PIE17166.1 MAG: FAD-binding oxidoreductase [Pseudomonadota bacterium]
MIKTTSLSPAALAELDSTLPASRLARGDAERMVYSRDQWPRTLLSLRDSRPVIAPPELVIWPESTREVCQVLRIAAKHGVPVVPWGAGSGVCGGAIPIAGGIALDLKRLSGLLRVDVEDHLATFQAGILGQILEDQLNLRGMTLGHFPSSIYCSTLGGWLASRSAGQCSSRYGKIEDMVESLEVVTGDGTVLRCGAHDYPDLLQLVVGSEGTLGVITEATLRTQPLPETRLLRAYHFPRVAAGCEGIRRVMQRGLRPAVLRLYDELDTLIANLGAPQGDQRTLLASALGLVVGGHDEDSTAEGSVEEARPANHKSQLKQRALRGLLSRAGLLNRVRDWLLPKLAEGCQLIVGCEGSSASAEAEAALAHAELIAAGGRDLGDRAAKRWFARRHAVSYKQSPLYAAGGFVDTMEVATHWGRLLRLYEEVRAALSPLAVVMAHFSHAYPEGCSIYFTFAAAAEPRGRAERLYDEIWRKGLSAVVRAGGTISHHHGVGYSKASFMADEHGHGIEVYRQLKQVLDPQGILNPGKMGL